MPCLIIGRHGQLPREVLVVCKQITGTLLLNNVREELKVRVNLQGNQTVSPSEFEAAAGCSKGKNWKVSNSPDLNLQVQSVETSVMRVGSFVACICACC